MDINPVVKEDPDELRDPAVVAKLRDLQQGDVVVWHQEVLALLEQVASEAIQVPGLKVVVVWVVEVDDAAGLKVLVENLKVDMKIIVINSNFYCDELMRSCSKKQM